MERSQPLHYMLMYDVTITRANGGRRRFMSGSGRMKVVAWVSGSAMTFSVSPDEARVRRV